MKGGKALPGSEASDPSGDEIELREVEGVSARTCWPILSCLWSMAGLLGHLAEPRSVGTPEVPELEILFRGVKPPVSGSDADPLVDTFSIGPRASHLMALTRKWPLRCDDEYRRCDPGGSGARSGLAEATPVQVRPEAVMR